MRISGLLVVLVLVMGLVLAACGDEDEDISAAGSSDNDSTPTVSSEPDATAATSDDSEETEPTSDSGTESEASEIDVEHAQGTTTVSMNPETVVVFDYSLLDTLDQLGVDVTGVPQGSNVPAFLSDYAGSDYENVGTLFEPDYEKINALDPDLIIVAGRSSAVYGELDKMAPTIDLTVDSTNFFESFKERTLALASIFGKDAEAEERIAEIEASIERTNDLATESGAKALIVMVSGGEVTAYGPGSRFGMIHDMLGVSAVEDDIEAATHGDAISFEFILEHNPDILYVIDRDAAVGQDGEAAEQVLDNELVRQTTAWTNDAVTYLNSATWYLANSGLSTFAEMVAEIENSLQ